MAGGRGLRQGQEVQQEQKEHRSPPPSHPPTPPQLRPEPPQQPPSPPVQRQDEESIEDAALGRKLDDELNAPLETKNPAELAKAPPRLNLAQRFAGGTVSFLETTAALIWGTAIAVDEEVPLLQVPGDYAVTTIAAIGAKEALQSLRILARREHPLDYLFLEGGGSFAKGLAMEVGKKAVAAIPPVLFAIGASYGRDALFNYAMANPEENQNLLMALFYFDTPLMRSILIGAPALLIYFAGQKIIERFVPGMRPPEVPPIDNEDTHWYQKVLDEGLLVLNSVTMAGLGRQIFNTMGPAVLLHSPYSLLMAPIAALFVLPLLHYVGEELHPFQSVQDFFAGLDPKPVPDTVLDGANGPQEVKDEGPGKARIAANIATKIGMAAGVFALAALVNRYASAAVSLRHGTGDEYVNDPSAWTTTERVGYEAALTAGTLIALRMLENLPAAIEKIKEYGPEVIENIKKGAPVVIQNLGDAVTAAATATADGVNGVKRAAYRVGEYWRPSVSGMFALNGNHHQAAAGKSQASNYIIDVNDFDLPDDENVTQGPVV